MVRLGVGALLLALGSASAVAQSSSASYRLVSQTLNSGGAPAASPSFRLTGSAGQEVTVEASSAGVVLQSGFWSFAGAGMVPVILTVDHTPGMPERVDLFWSGHSPSYDVYQSADCGNVFASPFGTTTQKTLPAVLPPPASIVCYNVLASTPAPPPPLAASVLDPHKESP